MDHIAASGHSRGGKTVLLAGATDERIRYVNPNGSGTHGCGAFRFLQREEEGRFGDAMSEPLQYMFDNIPYWMGQGLRAYIGREGELPYDSHFLKALIMPRCLIETNGYEDMPMCADASAITVPAGTSTASRNSVSSLITSTRIGPGHRCRNPSRRSPMTIWNRSTTGADRYFPTRPLDKFRKQVYKIAYLF